MKKYAFKILTKNKILNLSSSLVFLCLAAFFGLIIRVMSAMKAIYRKELGIEFTGEFFDTSFIMEFGTFYAPFILFAAFLFLSFEFFYIARTDKVDEMFSSVKNARKKFFHSQLFILTVFNSIICLPVFFIFNLVLF